MSRTNMVLVAIAAALFAFIVLWEKDSLTSGELEEARSQLLQRFVRGRVNRVVLQRGDERVVLEREREDRDDLLGTWYVREPIAAMADDDAVGSALSAVQYASARRTLKDVGSEDRARYGLDFPRLVVSFRVATEEITVAFGDDDPTGAGVYMQAGDDVHVVGRDVLEALDHDASYFRSKRLLEQGVLLAHRLEIEGGGEVRKLRQERDWWFIEEPTGAVRAASARVEEALGAFNDLEAQSFVDEGRFDPLFARVRADVPGSQEGDPAREVVVEVGALCQDETQRFVRVDGGVTACVLVSRLEPLLRPLADWRELRPLTTRDLELERLELKASATTLTVTEGEGRWRWTLHRAGQERSGDADDEALADWLQSIRRARAQSVVTSEDLRPYGLQPPRATLTVVDSSERQEHLEIGAVSTEGLYVHRRGEPVVLVVPSDAEDLFHPRVARLRERRLLDEATRAVKRLTIERGGVREELEDRDGGWEVVAPVQAPAMAEVRELARLLARLTADRFVADAATPEHGLTPPRVRVTIHLEPEEGEPRDVALDLGAATEGGAFARLDGEDAVFVVSDSLTRLVSAPLIARTLLQTPAIELERLVVEAEGVRRELSFDGRRIVGPDGPLPEDRSEALTGAIGRLRAEGATRYGPALASEGLAPPRARVEIARGEGAQPPLRYVILVGAPTGEGAEVFVRREDLPVTFTVAESAVAPLLDLP